MLLWWAMAQYLFLKFCIVNRSNTILFLACIQLLIHMHLHVRTHTCTHMPYHYPISTYNKITITKPSFGFAPLIFTHYIHHYRSSLSQTSRWCQLLLSLPPCLAQWNRCSPQIDRRLPAGFQTRANKEATNKSSFTAGQDQPHSLPSCSI